MEEYVSVKYVRGNTHTHKHTTLCVEILGDDHPETITVRAWLADTVYKKGDFAGALPLLKKVVEDRKRVQGVEHPFFSMSLNNLAECFRGMVRLFHFLCCCWHADTCTNS